MLASIACQTIMVLWQCTAEGASNEVGHGLSWPYPWQVTPWVWQRTFKMIVAQVYHKTLQHNHLSAVEHPLFHSRLLVIWDTFCARPDVTNTILHSNYAVTLWSCMHARWTAQQLLCNMAHSCRVGLGNGHAYRCEQHAYTRSYQAIARILCAIDLVTQYAAKRRAA